MIQIDNLFRPESFGVLIGCAFLVAMFLFIPIPFTFEEAALLDVKTGGKPPTFPHEEVIKEKFFLQHVYVCLCMLRLITSN